MVSSLQRLMWLYIYASVYVTESDEICLIAGKYMCSLNIVYFHFCLFCKLGKTSIKFYISGENFKQLSFPHEKLLNFKL